MYIEETISSLSLVSRDCYEIARAHQWHELSFGPSIIFSRLARRLLSDISRVDGIVKTSLPSLGHVVRSVQVYAAAIDRPSKHDLGRRPRQTHVGQQSLVLRYYSSWQDEEREDVLSTYCAIRDELVVLSEDWLGKAQALHIPTARDLSIFIQYIVATLIDRSFTSLQAFKWKRSDIGFDENGNFALCARLTKTRPGMSFDLLCSALQSRVQFIKLWQSALEYYQDWTDLDTIQNNLSITRITFSESGWRWDGGNTEALRKGRLAMHVFSLLTSLTFLEIQTHASIKLDLDPAHLPHYGFPVLECLILRLKPNTISLQALDALIPTQTRLRSLQLDFQSSIQPISQPNPEDTTLSSFFSSRGSVPSLTDLHWQYRPTAPTAKFIYKNPQLRKLFLHRPEGSVALLNTLPSTPFRYLTVLSVVLAGLIPSHIFSHLGALTSLEDLQLGHWCDSLWGIPDHIANCWKPDHDIIQQYLAPLTALRRLRFVNDCYEQHPKLPWQYYYRHALSNSQVDYLLNNWDSLNVELIKENHMADAEVDIRVDGRFFGGRSAMKNAEEDAAMFLPKLEDYSSTEESRIFYKEHQCKMKRYAQRYFDQHLQLSQVEVGRKDFFWGTPRNGSIIIKDRDTRSII
jgi:hypothetical protein